MAHDNINPGIWLLYSAFPNKEEAFLLARHLLEKKLIACANVYDQVTSLYRWEGEVRQEPEVILMAKTSQERVDAAIEVINERHSYDVPCITAWPVERGYAPYFAWIAEETKL